MKKLTTLGSIILVAAFAAALPTAQAAPGASSGHSHASGEPVSLGTLTVAGFDFGIVSSGPIKAGSEPHFDISFPADKTFPRAVRMWIGTENAIQTGKTRLAFEAGQSIHTHIPAPDPLAAEHKIWIEVDTPTGKVRGSLPINPAAEAQPEHGHEHAPALKAAITAGANNVYTLALTSGDTAVKPAGVQLILVDGSLADFQTIVPTPSESGAWSFTFTPKSTGNYKAFALVRDGAVKGLEVGTATIKLAGKAAPLAKTISETSTVSGYTFKADWGKAPLGKGKDNELTVTVVDSEGKPAPLTAVGGTPARIAVISADHRMLSLGELKSTSTVGQIKAGIEFQEVGYNKVFLIVSLNGKEVISSFGVNVPGAREQSEAEHGHKH